MKFSQCLVSTLVACLVLTQLPNSAYSLPQKNNKAEMSEGERGETSECAATLRVTKKKMEKGRKIKVVKLIKNDISQEYKDYPRNRPYEYLFGLSGAATNSFLNSPKIMTSISTDIIKNCKSVSMVAFNEYTTDATVSFGLINNRIQGFECLNPSQKAHWGQIVCI